jgi:hypothetical protein
VQNQVARHSRGSGRRTESPSVREGHGGARGVYDGTRQTVTEHPLASVLVTFAAGFAAGMLLSAALAPIRSRRGPRRHSGSRMEELGQRVMDAVSGYLPQPSRRRW